MTPAAQKMHEVMSSIDKLSEAQMAAIMRKVTKHINAVTDVFTELLYTDDVMFRRLFAPNFIRREQDRIISEFLGVDVINIGAAPERDEIVRFSLYIITCEILAQVFETVRLACGLQHKEFCVIWFILNERNSFKKIMITKNIDMNLVDPKIRGVLMKEKKELAALKEEP